MRSDYVYHIVKHRTTTFKNWNFGGGKKKNWNQHDLFLVRKVLTSKWCRGDRLTPYVTTPKLRSNIQIKIKPSKNQDETWGLTKNNLDLD